MDPLLDNISHVELIQHVGDDAMICAAARVSLANDLKVRSQEDNYKLIKYLLKNKHFSPVEHNLLTFRATAPLYVVQEMLRHRIGCCVTGDTIVTFVNNTGVTSKSLNKTIKELYEDWHIGEKHPLTTPQIVVDQIKEMAAANINYRQIANKTGVGWATVQRVCNSKLPAGFRSKQKRISNMRLRVLDESTGLFTTGHVEDVVYQGIQPVYKVTLEDNKTLTMTTNHKVYTSEGWQTMGHALGVQVINDEVLMTKDSYFMVNGNVVVGSGLYRDYDWMQKCRQDGYSVAQMASEAECSYHTIRKWLKIHDLKFSKQEIDKLFLNQTPWNKGKTGYKINLTPEARQVRSIRAKQKVGEKNNFWRGGITTERANIGAWTRLNAKVVHEKYDYTCQQCGQGSSILHAHHIIPVAADITKAYDIDNLITLCKSCHMEVHKSQANEIAFAEQALNKPVLFRVRVNKRIGQKLKAHPVKVTAIEYMGEQDTYDLCVTKPWHNFVANGIVVHNSFNQESARYIVVKNQAYIPKEFRGQGKTNRQSSVSNPDINQELVRELYAEQVNKAYQIYEQLLANGVCREQARGVLPHCTYTSLYITFNLRSLLHFLGLRLSEDAQWEIRQYAIAFKQLAEPIFPLTFKAYNELQVS